jgi:hypothetical protein
MPISEGTIVGQGLLWAPRSDQFSRRNNATSCSETWASDYVRPQALKQKIGLPYLKEGQI